VAAPLTLVLFYLPWRSLETHMAQNITKGSTDIVKQALADNKSSKISDY